MSDVTYLQLFLFTVDLDGDVGFLCISFVTGYWNTMKTGPQFQAP